MAETIEYDVNHFLFTFGGYLVNGRETWQCSMRFGSDTSLLPGGPTPPEIQAALSHISISDIYDAVKTWFQSAQAGVQYTSYTSLEWVKLAGIGKDGKYLYDALEKRQQTKGSSSGTWAYPPQLAVVVSLSSGSRIGFANHGRYFLPAPYAWVNTIDPNTGQNPTLNVDNLRASQKTMIEAVAGEVSTAELQTDLCIFSPLRSSSVKVKAPSHKRVTQIGIGFTTDTQRSRRRSLPDGITTWSSVST